MTTPDVVQTANRDGLGELCMEHGMEVGMCAGDRSQGAVACLVVGLSALCTQAGGGLAMKV